MAASIPGTPAPNTADVGLRCHRCGHRRFKTTHTIRQADRIRRRKVCRQCGRGVYSVELLQVDFIRASRGGSAT